MITQLLPGDGVPSESREKQPLPLPSLTLLQGKGEEIILVFFFSLSCDLQKQSRQPSTSGSSALSSVALPEEETWYYVVGVEIPNPQFQEQKEGASFSQLQGEPWGGPPSPDWAPQATWLWGRAEERCLFIHSTVTNLSFCYHRGHGSERGGHIPALTCRGWMLRGEAGIPEIRQMLDTSGEKPSAGKQGGEVALRDPQGWGHPIEDVRQSR